MSDESLRVLKALLAELKAIRHAVAPDNRPKPKSQASVASMADEGGDQDVPPQLSDEERRTQRWVEHPTRMPRKRA